MRNLKVSIVVGVLMGLVWVAPATADPKLYPEPNANMSRVTSFCPEFCVPGEQNTVQLPTGEWVNYHTGWSALTPEDLDFVLTTLDFEVYRDGVRQPNVEAHNRGLCAAPVCDPVVDLYIGDWDFAISPGRPNVPVELTVRQVVNENTPEFEGLVVGEFTRTIVWTPRGRFPSDDFPCTNGSHPCETRWKEWPAFLS